MGRRRSRPCGGLLREDAAVLGRSDGAERPEGEIHDRIRETLGRRAQFWFDLVDEVGIDLPSCFPRCGSRLGRRGDERRADAAARRAPLRDASTRAPAEAVLPPSRDGDHSDAGPLVAHRPPSPGSLDRRALAELLLERQGIVTRDGVRAEGITGGYSARLRRAQGARDAGAFQAGVLSSRDSGDSRTRRRGRADFASCDLADSETRSVEALVLAAADPAQLHGAALPWPKRADGRAARVAGAYVVLLGGERRSSSSEAGHLVPLRDPDPEWLRPALAALVEHVKSRRGVKRLAVERFDSEAVAETDVMPLLVEAGFTAGPRRAVLRP